MFRGHDCTVNFYFLITSSLCFSDHFDPNIIFQSFFGGDGGQGFSFGGAGGSGFPGGFSFQFG